MVRMRTNRISHNLSNSSFLNSIRNAAFSACTIRPLKSSNQSVLSAFTYFFILRFVTLAFMCILNKDLLFDDFSQILYEWLKFSFFAISASLFVSFLISYFAEMDFNGFLLLLIISSASYSPFLHLLIKFPVFHFFSFGVALIMMYYVESSIAYTPEEQRNYYIAHVMIYVGTYGVVTIFSY